MVETAWLYLTATEKRLLLEALRSLADRETNLRKIETLAIKISQGKAHPDITIGVYRRAGSVGSRASLSNSNPRLRW